MEKENILKELSFQKVIEVEKTFHFKNNLLQESGLKNLTNATTTLPTTRKEVRQAKVCIPLQL